MRRVVLSTAALAAAVAVWGLLLPPQRLALSGAGSDGTVRGTLHVHSRLSDGRGTLEEIAEAAKRAGLAFVVSTDHGDGTRPPRPPAYLSGVLCIDAVEISTRGGHYVALGLPQAPYPLAGEASDVVEDVRRLGGFGIAAHPDSPKQELRWSDWEVPVDGVELINPDTAWRVRAFNSGPESWFLLLRSLLAYPVRPAESISQLLTDVEPIRRHWAALTAVRPVVALAGVDAHAKFTLRDADPGDNRFSLPIPSYVSSFDSLSVHVTPTQPLTGDPAADAASILGGIRSGHVFVAIDGWASPAALEFTASSGSTTARMGESLPAGMPVMLHIRSNAPAGFTTSVRRGADAVARDRAESSFELAVGAEPGVYTVEVRRPGAGEGPAWITSNPIYVRSTESVDSGRDVAPVALSPRLNSARPLFDGKAIEGWSHENDPTSLAAVDLASLVTGNRVQLRYGLSGGSDVGQYAAAAVGVPTGLAVGLDGIRFSARAEGPMRISVQARTEAAGEVPLRWQRSVYLDGTEHEYRIRFDEMKPVPPAQGSPSTANLRAILFVIDTTNTAPGSSGRLWLGGVQLAEFVSRTP